MLQTLELTPAISRCKSLCDYRWLLDWCLDDGANLLEFGN